MNAPLSLENWSVKFLPAPDGSGKSQMVLVGQLRSQFGSRELLPVQTAPVAAEFVETIDGTVYRLGQPTHASPVFRFLHALATLFPRRTSTPRDSM